MKTLLSRVLYVRLNAWRRLARKSASATSCPCLPGTFICGDTRSGKPDEYLRLVDRYLQQAREKQVLAGANQTVRVTGCDDAGTLVQILGYRLRASCGQKTFSLETANPERAFLTIDSGFPLVDLEEALQNNTRLRLSLSFHAGAGSVSRSRLDWHSSRAQKRKPATMLDALIGDPNVAALYWAMSKQDTETNLAMERSPGLRGLLPFAEACSTSMAAADRSLGLAPAA